MVNPRLLCIALVAVLCMSAVPVLVKSTNANEISIGISRLFIAVLAFTPLALWRGRMLLLSFRQWGSLALIGLVFGLHWLAYFASIKYATPTIAALAVITYGVQYMILAYFFKGERFGPAECLAVVVCFAGCVIVTPELSWRNDISKGIAIGLFSATLYAILPLLHQRASAISTLGRTWGQFFFALLIFLPLWSFGQWDLNTKDAYQLLTLGILCTVIAHGLWVKSSTELPAIWTSLIYYLSLPMALVSSVIFLDEAMTPNKLLGCTLVVGSSMALCVHRYRAQRVEKT